MGHPMGLEPITSRVITSGARPIELRMHGAEGWNRTTYLFRLGLNCSAGELPPQGADLERISAEDLSTGCGHYRCGQCEIIMYPP